VLRDHEVKKANVRLKYRVGVPLVLLLVNGASNIDFQNW